MSYIIKKANGSILVEVSEETVNTTAASVALVGRGSMTYGAFFAENFVHLTENFAHSVPPSAPMKGQLWFDTGSNAVKVYTGSAWVGVGASLVNQESPQTIAGSMGLRLPTTDGDITVVALLAHGLIVALVGRAAVPRANLPDTVTINGSSYAVKERFPTGLKPGITFARTTTDSYVLDGSVTWGSERTFAFTGDVTGSVPVDGSANANVALTLANTGVVPGTYAQVTVDAKGRVIAGVAGSTITLSGDASGTLANGGGLAVTLTPTGVTPGSYGTGTDIPTFSVDAAGRITGVGNTAIQAASTSQPGIVQLSTALDSNSTALAATASALKAVADRTIVHGTGVSVLNGDWSIGDAAAVAADFATSEEAMQGASSEKVMSPATTKAVVASEIAKYAVSDGHVATLNVPVGGIVVWSGTVATIPPGWALCDGATVTTSTGDKVTTPDLRNRFIVGAGDDYPVGATGGAASVALTVAQLPAHAHGFSGTTSSDGTHAHTITYQEVDEGDPRHPGGSASTDTAPTNIATPLAGAHTHTFSGTTASVGSGNAHENRPPYYALAYIMRVEIVQETVPSAINALVANSLASAATITLLGDLSGAPTFDGTSTTWNVQVTGSVATRWTASTDEAEGGDNDSKFMTPLKTKQAIIALATTSPVGSVGSYAFLGQTTRTKSAPGDVVSGSDLRYGGVAGSNPYSMSYSDGNGTGSVGSTEAPAGTWRCMGRSSADTYNNYGLTLWQRIA